MGKENSCLRTIANADGAAILDTEAGQITTLNPTEQWSGRRSSEAKSRTLLLRLLPV